MEYIDKEFYRETYKGDTIPDADFAMLLDRAAEIAEEMTVYRVTETSFANMNADMRNRVKRAICAEMEYLNANGGSDIDNGADLTSAALGKFSYSKETAGDAGGAQSIYAPRALRILAPTGLLYRGGAL